MWAMAMLTRSGLSTPVLWTPAPPLRGGKLCARMTDKEAGTPQHLQLPDIFDKSATNTKHVHD